ncbi:hypothetical protein HPULCUR_005341 [Helicostylum pulchrum]|uniref:Uncharacterized protein n=1 Tax=Helicostylum pulchrum TaxID=562976 RepID=A0ABP9XYS5_9FUNG
MATIPDSNKLSSNYIINESFAEKFSIHKCLCDIYASDFSDMIKVIDAYIEKEGGEQDTDKAHCAIVEAFSTLSKSSQYRALAEYAESLGLYYINQKTRFSELYLQRLKRPTFSRLRPTSSGITAKRVYRKKRPRAGSESSSISVPTSPSSIAILEATGPENNLDLSHVKGIITTVAKDLLETLDAGKKIKLTDYKLMSTGLSSVVDLVDQNEDSQRQVFEEKHWNNLSKLAQEFHKSELYQLPKFLKDTWKLVSVFCEKTGSTKKAQEYLKEIINPKTSFNKKPETLKIISIFLLVLEIFEESKWLFETDREKAGNDFFSILWGPIIRKMLSIHNNIIDLKCDEAIDPHIIFMQKMQVQDAENISSAAVNLKFVLKVDDTEKCVGRMQVLDAASSKTDLQVAEGSLLLKSKDSLNTVLIDSKDLSEARYLQGTCIQVAGLVGHVFSVKLHQPRIYVGLPNSTINMPSRFVCFSSFSEMFESLMTSIIKMENLAGAIINNHAISQNRDLFNNMFNHTDTETRSLNLGAYLAPTWYPFQETSITETETSSELPTGEDSALQVDYDYDNQLVDQYGWVKLKNRKFYNVETNVTQSVHPFSRTIV